MSRTAAAATDVDAGSDDEGHFAFSSVDDWALHNEAKSTRTVEKQATAVATQNAATSVVQTEKKSGLSKRGDLNKSYKERWFVLNAGQLLYFSNQSAAEKTTNSLGSIALVGASIVRDPESPPTGNGSNGTSGNGSGGNSFDDKKAEESARTFGIRPKNNNRTYILRAATVEEAEEWIASLRRVAAAAAAGTTTPAATTAAQLTAPHPRSNKRIVRRLFDELCYGCRQSFTFIRRRHHCRNCGHAFCDDCSKHNMRIPDSGSDAAVRVCDDCASQLQQQKEKTQNGRGGANNSGRSNSHLVTNSKPTAHTRTPSAPVHVVAAHPPPPPPSSSTTATTTSTTHPFPFLSPIKQQPLTGSVSSDYQHFTDDGSDSEDDAIDADERLRKKNSSWCCCFTSSDEPKQRRRMRGRRL